jgi:signal transduction histidine kinase
MARTEKAGSRRTHDSQVKRRAVSAAARASLPELSLAALRRVENAVWLCDSKRATVWCNERMELLEAELQTGGALAQLVDPAWVPSDGDVTLDHGRTLSWAVELVELATGEPGYAFTFSNNDASRKLAECEARLRLLSTHTRGIIFELDSSARFVRVWASDPALLAKPEAELLGRTLLEVLGGQVGAWHHDKVLTTLASGVDQEYEYELEVPSGRRHFGCSAVALPGIDGKRSAAFWIRDTTAEVALRAKLLRAERLASIGTLAAGVAHEINNPLAYMLLNLERIESLVASSEHDSRQHLELHLAMVRDGMQRVRRIVADLLTFAKTEPRTSEVDVACALEVAIDAAAAEINARGQLLRHYGDVPTVQADEARLAQVFSNLLLNAVQALTEVPSRDRTIEVVTNTSADGQACIEVHDSGPGVPDHLLTTIFEPFFTTKANGTGLGLPICQNIVQSFGGQITAHNRAQGGLVVTVTLPPARAPVGGH